MTAVARGRKLVIRGVVSMAAVTAIGCTWMIARGGGDLADMREGRGGSDLDVREYLYRVANGYTNGTSGGEGSGYLQPDPVASKPGAERHLLMGDSYTFGWGLANLDARWSTQLTLELGEEHEVDTYSLPGASLYTYANWVKGMGLDVGAYDTIVIGLSENDPHPGPLEAVGKRETYTFYDDLPESMRDEIEQGVLENPNLRELKAALAYLKTVGERHVIVPLYGVDQAYWPSIERSVAAARELGWEIAPMRNTQTTILGRTPGSLTVAPFDTHPNELLHAAYAADAGTMFERLGSGSADLIGHVSPVPNRIELNEKQAEIWYDGLSFLCIPVSHPRGSHLCADEPYSDIGGTRYGIQWGECRPFGGGAVVVSLPRGARQLQLGETKPHRSDLMVWAAGRNLTWRMLDMKGGKAILEPSDRQIAISAGSGCGEGEIIPPTVRIVIK